ncbi:histidine kinase [Chryseobacterium sp. MYb264]|uniref:sensor histidine kinase n=1 Tax=Chryseobacterium sp. MYb264 TaxID=2745153 RepID=UPI002E156744|nr:histidine kinase [Chryseobacterium sp. MYb264]
MKDLPEELRATYFLAIVIMMFFVGFIIFVVLMYNRRQLLYLKEKQLRESEHQNQLLQKELEKQKSIEKERERISHDMHDDLGAGISALKLQAEFLKQRLQDEEFRTDIDELLKTSEEMNLSMREMLWSLHSGNDTVGSFINYAKMYAVNFLKKTKIKLQFEEENVVSDFPISTELRGNLFLCVKEALNNAYKHSDSVQLNVSFRQNVEKFSIKISDDGIGINHENKEGNGLRNMHRRMQECNGSLKILPIKKGTVLLFEVLF